MHLNTLCQPLFSVGTCFHMGTNKHLIYCHFHLHTNNSESSSEKTSSITPATSLSCKCFAFLHSHQSSLYTQCNHTFTKEQEVVLWENITCKYMNWYIKLPSSSVKVWLHLSNISGRYEQLHVHQHENIDGCVWRRWHKITKTRSTYLAVNVLILPFHLQGA
jgi:hypothetical protein